MFMKNKNEDTITVLCDCGCDNGVIIKAEKDDGFTEYDISLVSDIYYSSQRTIIERFVEKCKRIWKIICNKEHYYFNICLSEEDINEIMAFINSNR